MQNKSQLTLSTLLLLSSALPGFAATRYQQHNLVSDIPGLADQTDSNLTNPWGIAMSSTSPFWISNNHSGTATVYDGQGKAASIIVTVPAPPKGAPPASPTGQVFNDTGAFAISGKSALFIFATEDGTISGWNPGADAKNAVILVDNSASGAVYKGLALANTTNGPMLFAANFNAGTVDVFDGNLARFNTPGGFVDPNLPAGFAPFNILRAGQKLYVTYAMQNGEKHDDVAGAGNGFIDVFDFNGNLLGNLASNGALNSPWGLVLAPSNFGDFSNALLVGNFGDGVINAYDPCSGGWLGTLQDADGKNILNPGLWALVFGNGRGAGDAVTLYFTAGIPGGGQVEDHGLFGNVQVAVAAAPPAAAPPAPAPQASTVTISNFAFAPTPITVAAGTKIVWTNQDGTAHTVAADDGKYNSDPLDKTQSFSQTLTAPGTYAYHCSIHPFMKGKIVVQ